MWGCAASVYGAVNSLSSQITVNGRLQKVILYEFIVGWVGIG
jgi:hypothetical protein